MLQVAPLNLYIEYRLFVLNACCLTQILIHHYIQYQNFLPENIVKVSNLRSFPDKQLAVGLCFVDSIVFFMVISLTFVYHILQSFHSTGFTVSQCFSLSGRSH